MTQPYSVAASWENKQGVHNATLRFQPEIATRPGCVGISLSEEIKSGPHHPIGEAGDGRYMACIVLDRPLALQWHRHFALVLEDPMVPASALREALELLERSVDRAGADDPRADQWEQVGERLERLKRYLPAEPV